MAIVYGDRVQETSTTTGLSDYVLAGAVTGFQSFSDGVGSGNQTYYTATDGTDWETGRGTFTAGTLTRAVILDSSNAGAAVNWPAGEKNVFVVSPARVQSRLTPPLAADFPTTLSPAAQLSKADALEGLAVVVSPGTGTRELRGFLQGLASPPATYTFGIAVSVVSSGLSVPTSDPIGVIVRDSVAGSLIIFGYQYNPNEENYELTVIRFTDPATFSAEVVDYVSADPRSAYFRIVDDGANFAYQYSLDGSIWVDILTESRTAFLPAPDEIGIGLRDDQVAVDYSLLVKHYEVS